MSIIARPQRTHVYAGLVAIHPIAEALKDEYFYFAWLLRHEAFLRFGYDPDAVLSEKTGGYGFRGGGRSGIPGANLLDLRARSKILEESSRRH